MVLRLTCSFVVLGFSLVALPEAVHAQTAEKAESRAEKGSLGAPVKAGSLGTKPSAGSFSSGKPRAGSLTAGKPAAGSLSAGKPSAGSMATGVVGGSLSRPVGSRIGTIGLSARQRRLNRERDRAQEIADDDSTRTRSERDDRRSRRR